VVDVSVGDDPSPTGRGRRGRVDHSSAGAVLAHERGGGRLSPASAALAMAIAAHHAGLPPYATFEAERLKDPAKR
jgi:hypothetical protein